jgi:hypothetical protein
MVILKQRLIDKLFMVLTTLKNFNPFHKLYNNKCTMGGLIAKERPLPDNPPDTIHEENDLFNRKLELKNIWCI